MLAHSGYKNSHLCCSKTRQSLLGAYSSATSYIHAHGKSIFSSYPLLQMKWIKSWGHLCWPTAHYIRNTQPRPLKDCRAVFSWLQEFLPAHFTQIAIYVKSTDTGAISTLGHWMKKGIFVLALEEYQGRQSMEVEGTWRNLVSQSSRNGTGYVRRRKFTNLWQALLLTSQVIKRIMVSAREREPMEKGEGWAWRSKEKKWPPL